MLSRVTSIAFAGLLSALSSRSPVGDVHRAALAAAAPVFTIEELAHHCFRVHALHQRMAVPAMGGEQQIVAFQIRADAGRAGFLVE